MSNAPEDLAVLGTIVDQLDRNASAEVPATIVVTGGYALTGCIIGVSAYKQAFEARAADFVRESPTFQGQIGGAASVRNLIENRIKDVTGGSGYVSFRNDYLAEAKQVAPDGSQQIVKVVASSYWRVRLSDVIAWSLGHAPVAR